MRVSCKSCAIARTFRRNRLRHVNHQKLSGAAISRVNTSIVSTTCRPQTRENPQRRREQASPPPPPRVRCRLLLLRADQHELARGSAAAVALCRPLDESRSKAKTISGDIVNSVFVAYQRFVLCISRIFLQNVRERHYLTEKLA
jgi:hypothetical protein